MPSKKTRTHVPALFDSCGQKEIIIDVRDHPTPTDLRKNMNSDLVDMFLKTCNPMRKILLGVDKPLQGPNMAQMWIDPADRLKGKVQFTPPKDILCLKALTHESILNIGKSFEDKLQQTQEQLILKAVKDAKENAKFEFDLRIKFAVDNERKLQEKIWQTKFDKLKEDYEQEKGLMTKFYEEGRAILCNSLSNKFSIETNKMIDKAVEDAEYKKDLKCTEFLNQELAGQHDQHAENLRNTMRNLQTNYSKKMETMREECLKAMDLQHQMLSSRRDDSPKKNHTIETQEKLMQTENYVFGKNSANLEIVWNEFKKDLDLLLNYDSLVSEIPKLSKSILVQVKQNMQQSDSIQRNESSQLFISQEKRLNREQEPLAEKLNPKLASVDKISNPEGILNGTLQEKLRESGSVKAVGSRIIQANQFVADIMERIDGKHAQSKVFHTLKNSNIVETIFDFVKSAEENDLSRKTIEDEIYEELMKLNLHFVEEPEPEDLILSRRISLDIKDSLEIHHKKIKSKIPCESRILCGVVDSFEILRHSYPKVLHSDEIPTSATPSKLSMGLPESYTEKYYKLPSYMRLPQRILQSAETKSKNSKTSSEDSNISESTINEFDSESHVKIVHFRQFREPNTLERRVTNTSSILKHSEPRSTEDFLKPIKDKLKDLQNNYKHL